MLSADSALIADYAGEAVADALGRAGELMILAAEERMRERLPIRTQADAARLLKALIGFRPEERLIVLFLDTGRRLIDYETVAFGRPDSVDFDCRRILLRTVGRGASGIIVAHNHPSGDARPSQSDIEVTRQLADASRALGIRLYDHFVVAGGQVRSAMFSG